jgi:hypothetical protein
MAVGDRVEDWPRTARVAKACDTQRDSEVRLVLRLPTGDRVVPNTEMEPLLPTPGKVQIVATHGHHWCQATFSAVRVPAAGRVGLDKQPRRASLNNAPPTDGGAR